MLCMVGCSNIADFNTGVSLHSFPVLKESARYFVGSSIGVGGTSTVFILDLWYNFFVLDFSLPPTMESKYSN